MAFSFPRINITVNDSKGNDAQGELSALSLGFGIRQAWMYSSMFGGGVIFNSSTLATFGSGGAMTLDAVTLSIVVFTLALMFAGVTDQRFLKFYTSKQTLVGSALLTSLGTFGLVAVPEAGVAASVALIVSAVATGAGSAMLLLFWGVAYSRDSAASIVINTAVSIVIAVFIYSFVLHIVPAPWAGILTALLPFFELPLLWQLTPVSYAVRRAIPIFNPLPVKKLPFAVRFGLPVLLFGFALGVFRSVSTQVILLSNDITTQLLALFAGSAATVLLLLTVFSIDKRSHWDFMFKPLVPFIIVTLIFLPSLHLTNNLVAPSVLLTGYMCFEALMWVFFSEISQEFRLSPIFVFSIGRACLSLGSLVGAKLIVESPALHVLAPFGQAGDTVLLMLVLVIAYALLPRVRDIKRVVKTDEPSMSDSIAWLNKQSEQILSGLQHAAGAARKIGGANQLIEVELLDGNLFTDEDDQELGLINSDSRAQDGVNASPASPANSERAASAEAVSGSTPSSTGSASKTATTGATLRESARAQMLGSAQSTLSRTEESTDVGGRFRGRCEAIADRYLLSRRETEVLFILAKGHNAAYIQDKLCISRSTVKTHISHIYRKLDIHSQQELLNMIEETHESE